VKKRDQVCVGTLVNDIILKKRADSRRRERTWEGGGEKGPWTGRNLRQNNSSGKCYITAGKAIPPNKMQNGSRAGCFHREGGTEELSKVRSLSRGDASGENICRKCLVVGKTKRGQKRLGVVNGQEGKA